MEDSSRASAASALDGSWDGAELLAALRSAARWLEQHVDEVNALNVFPVPDGDTGTNMSLTLKSALEGVTPAPSCAAVADRVGYWAMMRGRGNSGIILSQVLRGFAHGLAGHERMGAAEFANGLAHASTMAYKAVMKPVEGTMLTVIRETSEAARTVAVDGAALPAVLNAAAHAAHESVRRTPLLLKTLRDAGVVDSGGQGLALIFEGLARFARGESVERVAEQEPHQPAMAFADMHGPDDFGYCTNFVLQGQAMPYEQIRAAFAAMGQSVAVVGDPQMIKVHLHLLRPGDALNYAVQYGALANIEITNMDAQRAALHEAQVQAGAPHVLNGSATTVKAEPYSTQVGVVAVAPGDGFTAIFRSLNAGAIVEGGQTFNPSTSDLLAAINSLPQQDVIVLPNNRNVIMAAQQAAELSSKRVEVIPSKTLPQGIAAMLSRNYQADLAANVQAMSGALQHICTAEITTAVRDATVDGVQVREGQTIGLLDGNLVTADDAADVVLDNLLDRMSLDEREIVAIYFGAARERADAEALAERIQTRFPDLAEVEVQEGGQALYDYIISAE